MLRLLSRVCLLTLITTLAGCSFLSNPTEPVPVDGAVHYTALGASDTIGFGGSIVCVPFANCPDGTGYVQRVSRHLDAAHEDYDDTNLGIPGAVLSPRMVALAADIGRTDVFANLIEREARFVPRDSTVATVFAGGNDANIVGAAVLAGRGGSDVAAYIDSQIAAWATDFAELIAGIRERAPQSRIIVLNLPNLSRLPYMAGRSSQEREWMRRLSVGYAAAANATHGNNVVVIDLLCHAPIYDAGIYSSDGFHPNDAGYLMMANLVTTALTITPPQPSTGCASAN
jgi:lysophospholipase L1-like esterase